MFLSGVLSEHVRIRKVRPYKVYIEVKTSGGKFSKQRLRNSRSSRAEILEESGDINLAINN